MNYEVVIGIEIHCELKTKTKMFSGAPVSFEEEVNSCTNEVDLGMPGTLPCVNKQAVASAIKACTALKCEIDPLIKFDRKNYYYSDLPKGFQITQQFYPIGKNGFININVDGNEKKIRINRIHMEEDTAKQLHLSDGSYIDFNRAGTPLVEIVSEPDMSNGKEAQAYVEALRSILFYLNVSDCKMEEGSLRCDVNVSINKAGEPFGTKVEIKNLNSIANIAKAIDYEINRQAELLDKGEVVVQATRRFDEATRQTVQMRKKEGAVDYKYFPEPNIFPILLSNEWIKEVQDSMGELPSERKQKYIEEFGLNEKDSDQLINNKEISDFFNEVVKYTKEYKLAANWTLVDLNGQLNKDNKSLSQTEIKPQDLASLIEMVKHNKINSKQAKSVFEDVYTGKDPKQVVKDKGMEQVSDENAILKMVEEVLENNPQSIEDYKNGKDRAVGFLVGQVMKLSKGQANPALANKLIVDELKKR